MEFRTEWEDLGLIAPYQEWHFLEALISLLSDNGLLYYSCNIIVTCNNLCVEYNKFNYYYIEKDKILKTWSRVNNNRRCRRVKDGQSRRIDGTSFVVGRWIWNVGCQIWNVAIEKRRIWNVRIEKCRIRYCVFDHGDDEDAEVDPHHVVLDLTPEHHQGQNATGTWPETSGQRHFERLKKNSKYVKINFYYDL